MRREYRQCRCPRLVPVKDGHLMTVFNEVDGKRVSHMAETHHTDASDDEFGRLGRLTGISGRCGHVAPRWQEGSNVAGQPASSIHAGEASIKDELGYAGGSVNLDLQDVRLRRKQHPDLQLFGGHLASMQR
jgi:hypothetical protein